MKKLVLLIMLIMSNSAFSTNADNPHILISDNYIGYDHDDDHHDDDDDHSALPINDYLYLLLILGCVYAFKTKNNKTSFKK